MLLDFSFQNTNTISTMKNTIKVERAKKNWTLADLAQKIGVSRQAVNSIEIGKFVPSTVLALQMAKEFGTTVEIIFQLEYAD
jgi:putative transcriptional regulator